MLDIWQVGGLRGTGSLSFEADDVFVPAARSYPTNAKSSEPGPIYVLPTTLMFCSGFRDRRAQHGTRGARRRD